MLIIKSIVYRIIRIFLLLIVALIVLGDIKVALSISFIDALVATVYYYYFDKYWELYGEPCVKYCVRHFKYRSFDNK